MRYFFQILLFVGTISCLSFNITTKVYVVDPFFFYSCTGYTQGTYAVSNSSQTYNWEADIVSVSDVCGSIPTSSFGCEGGDLSLVAIVDSDNSFSLQFTYDTYPIKCSFNLTETQIERGASNSCTSSGDGATQTFYAWVCGASDD